MLQRGTLIVGSIQNLSIGDKDSIEVCIVLNYNVGTTWCAPSYSVYVCSTGKTSVVYTGYVKKILQKIN